MKPGNTFIACLFFLGIATITIAEITYTTPTVSPTHINRELLGERITVSGTVQRIHEAEEAQFIQLVENPNLDVVKFTDRNASVREGETVRIHGTVDLYHGNLEIIAETVKPADT